MSLPAAAPIGSREAGPIRPLTVLIATCNRADSLRQVLTCLEAAASQALGPWHLLVVNNASTDHTEAVLADFESRLPLVHVVESRQGKWAALNRGMSEVSTDDVALTDDDVLLPPDWIAAWQRGFAMAPDAGWFGGPIELAWPDPKPAWVRDTDASHPLYRVYGYYYKGASSRPYSEGDGFPNGANMGLRRSQVSRLSGYRHDLGPVAGQARVTSGDTDLIRRARDAGIEGWYVHDAIVRHRVSPSYFDYGALWKRGIGYGRGMVRMDPATPPGSRGGMIRNLARALTRFVLRRQVGSRWCFFQAAVERGIGIERKASAASAPGSA